MKFLEKAKSLAGLFNSMLSKRKFTSVYRKNLFQGKESRSGGGSDLTQTARIRKELPLLLKEFGIRFLIDAPCGDLYWMREVDLPVKKYIGVDIVKEIVEINKTKFADQQRTFSELNISRDILPTADMILCRDCLVHLSFKQAIQIINNFKESGSKYLLTTTFINRSTNDELGRGFWRTLNMEKEPFNFPKPVRIINEECTEFDGKYTDKCLGLYLLNDICLTIPPLKQL